MGMQQPELSTSQCWKKLAEAAISNDLNTALLVHEPSGL